MNPILLQTPAAPAVSAGARKPDRGAGDGAFADEIRDAAGRAGAPTRDPEAAEPEAEEAGEGEMSLRAPTPDTAMAGLLAALSGGTKPSRAEGQDFAPRSATAGSVLAGLNAELAASTADDFAAMPSEAEDLGEVDLRTALLRVADADPRSNGRAQVKIAHQETHFEPATRAAVIVEGAEPAAAAPAAPKASALLQLLTPSRGEVAQDRAATIEEAQNATATSQDGGEMSPAPVTKDAGATRGRRTSERLAGAALAFAPRVEQPAGRDADAAPLRSSALPVASEMLAPLAGAGTPTSLSTQVAGRIVDAFGGPVPQQPHAAPAETHLRLRAGGGVLKTLTIQLQPEHLGTLNVSMRLTDGQLTIEMAASRAETARLLSEDRGALRSLLEKAGFSIEDTAIAVVNRDSASLAPVPSAREATDPAGRETARHPNGQGGGEGRSRQDTPEARRTMPEPAGQPASPRSGATFL